MSDLGKSEEGAPGSALPPALNGGHLGQPMPVGAYQEIRRQALAERLVAVFAEQGYPRTTVDDLVAAGGVGVGTFYELFGGKEQCFDLIHQSLLTEAESDLLASIDRSAPWQARAREALGAVLRWADARPERARVILIEARSSTPAGLARYQRSINRFADALSAGRSLLPVSAALPPSLEFGLVSGVAYLLTCRLVERKLVHDPELVDELTRFLLAPYLGCSA
jgi:AcrR family transcriptional regulator